MVVPAVSVDRGRLRNAEVLVLAGEVDTYLLHRLEDELARVEDDPVPLIVSFEEATFVDSTIVGAVIAAAQAAERRGRTFLCYLPADAAYEVQRVFDTAGLETILPVHRSWSSVLRAVSPAA